MFAPQLTPSNATGTASRHALLAVGSQMLPIVNDGPPWLSKTFSVAFVNFGPLSVDMPTSFNGRFPAAFVQYSFDFTQLEDRNEEVVCSKMFAEALLDASLRMDGGVLDLGSARRGRWQLERAYRRRRQNSP